MAAPSGHKQSKFSFSYKCISLPDNFKGIIIFLMVDTHDKHGGICTGCRDDDSLGTTLKMSLVREKAKVQTQEMQSSVYV